VMPLCTAHLAIQRTSHVSDGCATKGQFEGLVLSGPGALDALGLA
jgi:hypothetical protein